MTIIFERVDIEFLEGAGHFVRWERPDVAARRIAEFVKSRFD